MDNNIKGNVRGINLRDFFDDDWMSHISHFQPSVIDHETEVKFCDKFWFYNSVERIKYPSIRESIMNSSEYQLYERIKEDYKKRGKHKKK